MGIRKWRRWNTRLQNCSAAVQRIALEWYTRSAHRGQIDPGCNACQELSHLQGMAARPAKRRQPGVFETVARVQRDAAMCEMTQANPVPTLQQIGDKFGLTADIVWHILHKNGVHKRPQHAVPHLSEPRLRKTI